MNLIYIASPYTHESKLVETIRFNLVCGYCAALLKDGQYCYSPIVHNHPIAMIAELPTKWEFWKSFDQLMIEKCNSMHVLQLDDWEKSKGIKAEVEIAIRLEIPIEYVKPGEIP